MSNITKAQKYLETFGYIESPHLETFGFAKTAAPVGPLGLRERVMGGSKTRDALSLFQSRFNLAVTGEADAATLALMSASHPRCGFPDVGLFVTTGSKWPSADISYSIRNLTADLEPWEAERDILAAFDLWSDVAHLNFIRLNGTADIEISFVRGNHGDGNAFDGPSGILAHAYFPASGIALAGDVHMDEDEDWRSTDMLSVIAHEFGHSLGLNHSFTAGALMYPYYSGPHRFLHDDDKLGIISIYGAAVAPPPPVPPPPPPPPPPVPPAPPPAPVPPEEWILGIDMSYAHVSAEDARHLFSLGYRVAGQCLVAAPPGKFEQPAHRVTNLRNLADAGFIIFGYASLRPEASGTFAIDQWARKGMPDDLWQQLWFVAPDVEIPGLTLQHSLQALAELHRHGKHLEVIYTNYKSWHDDMGNPPFPSECWLWNAFWDFPTPDADVDYPRFPFGGVPLARVCGEQWSGTFTIGGDAVDRNVFRKSFLPSATPPTDPPPEPPPEPPPTPPPGVPTPSAIGLGIRFSDGTVKEIHVWP